MLATIRARWRWSLVALALLGACDAHALSKQQASALLLSYLQQHCILDREEFPAADGDRYNRFFDFYRAVVRGNPGRYPRQGDAVGSNTFGGTFGETGELMPLSFTVASSSRGAVSIEFCPWYTTQVQIFDLVQVGPDTERVTFGQTKTLSRLTTDMSAAGVLPTIPPSNAQARLALLRRGGSGTWTVEPNS